MLLLPVALLLAVGSACTRSVSALPSVGPSRHPASASSGVTSSASSAAVPERLLALRRYIDQNWITLRRSPHDLVKAAAETKVDATTRILLYVARRENRDAVVARLRETMPAEAFGHLDVRTLPEDLSTLREDGLLYLPFPYVVPGGRFNEMYGWDSYFILLGLLQDGHVELARQMTDNLVYEVFHYGQVLNANRTYYLTRSQPPFLSRMALEVFRRIHDQTWLEETLPAILAYYQVWTRPPHGTTGSRLARYHGGASTPAPEVVYGERDAAGKNHYDRVRDAFRTSTPPDAPPTTAYDRARDQLTPQFYLADRAMRESGFDPTSRFGPFGAETLSYYPVDLNCLLYQMEKDIAEITRLVGRGSEAANFDRAADQRAAEINARLWDESAGLYFDYNFDKKELSKTPYLVTFYPLWVGLAPRGRAARVVAQLPQFERPGGLRTSTKQSGTQWDAPFGWAPLQLIATEGLRRYGYNADADRVATKFLRMVLNDFARHGTMKEKYDVETVSSDVTAGLRFGYTQNEIGFGWTNAAFLQLYDQLSPAARMRVQ